MQAMKQFSNWEAREERKFQADVLQEQRGVLFVGDTYEAPPPDSTTGVLLVTADSAPEGSKATQGKRPSAFASARKPDKKSIVLPLPDSVQRAAPEQLHRTLSKGKATADKGTDAGAQLPLRRSSSMPADIPMDDKADKPSPGTTEGDIILRHHTWSSGPQQRGECKE